MKLNGFTLAEMLVVMLIIAVMAMLTIPTVVKTNRDRAYSDMLDKTYQKIETALIVDRIFGLDISSYGISQVDRNFNSKTFFMLLNEKLKVIKNCGMSEEGCFGPTDLPGYKLRLISGAGLLVNDDFRGEKTLLMCIIKFLARRTLI